MGWAGARTLTFPQVIPVCSPGWGVLPPARGKLLEGFKQGSNKIRFFLNHLHIFQYKVNFMADEASLGERGPSLFSEPQFVPLNFTKLKILLTHLQGCCKDCISSLLRADGESRPSDQR